MTAATAVTSLVLCDNTCRKTADVVGRALHSDAPRQLCTAVRVLCSTGQHYSTLRYLLVAGHGCYLGRLA